MNASASSDPAWAPLYSAAAEFQSLAPWAWMHDSAIFGVQDPAGGRTAYCSVLGRLGQFHALQALFGPEGLDLFGRLAAGASGAVDDEDMISRDGLMASFEDRTAQSARDLKTIKALGLKFRGATAWPLFRSLRPGYLPWHLEAGEAFFLTQLLQQAAIVCARVRESPELLHPPGRDDYLVRVRQADGAWTDRWTSPGPLPEPPSVVIPMPNEEFAVRFRASNPRRCKAWEADLFHAPIVVIDEKNVGRPYNPPAALLVDAESHAVLAVKLLEPAGDLFLATPRFAEELLDVVCGTRALPETVAVRSGMLADALAPVAERMGFKIVPARRLPVLEAFKRELFARME